MKRKNCIMILLICSIFFSMMTMEASAANIPYRSITTTSLTARFEKAGNYYIWVKDYKELYCAKTKKGKAKCLKSLSKNGDYWVDNTVITDGNTIFYLQYKDDAAYSPKISTIYKTTVDGKKTKKIVTLYNVNNICGYYDGKIYYSSYDEDDSGWLWHHTYSYDIKTGKIKRILKNTVTQSSYGKYLVTMTGADGGGNKAFYVTDLTKNNKVEIAYCYQAVVYKNSVYYVKKDNIGRTSFKKYSIATKKTKLIKKIKKGIYGFAGRFKGGYLKDDKAYSFSYK